MMEDVTFPTRKWTQFGVKHVVKEIPNIHMTGVLAPEILTAMQNGETNFSQQRMSAAAKAMESGDYRELMPPNEDVTTKPIRQWEFAVNRDGYDIMVTAYCLESQIHCFKPAIVYFHGGGWRMGSRKNVENPLRLLTQLSEAVIFSVEYRLAPEYMFPCGTDDCWKVLRYIHANAEALLVNPDKITIAGDSAGGNLAAACSRRDRNMRTHMISQQVLIYPALSHVAPSGADYHFSLDDYEFDDSQAKWIIPSIQGIADSITGSFLYVRNQEEALSPDASPLLDKNFSGLPKTVMICAEYDYLTCQSKTYAKRLAAAGVDTTLIVYRGTNHGFMTRVGRYLQAYDLQKEFAATVK